MISKKALLEYSELLASMSVHIPAINDAGVLPVPVIELTTPQPSDNPPRSVVYWFHLFLSISALVKKE